MSVTVNVGREDSPPSVASPAVDQDALIQRMIEIIKRINVTAVMGASNRRADRQRTAGFVTHTVDALRYGHDYAKSTRVRRWLFKAKAWLRVKQAAPAPHSSAPEQAKQALVELAPALRFSFLEALYLHHYRSGNCGELSSAVFHQLWLQRPDSVFRVERISFNVIDHVMVLINRPEGSDDFDPPSWAGALILDPWMQRVYAAEDFEQQAREVARLCKEEEHALAAIGRLRKPAQYDLETVSLGVHSVCEVKTGKWPNCPDLHAYLPAELLEGLDSSEERSRYATVLSQITALSSTQCTRDEL